MAYHEGEDKAELFETSTDRTLNLLGFIIGRHEKINSIQFYYEKKLI
jgi:hypothetical protein